MQLLHTPLSHCSPQHAITPILPFSSLSTHPNPLSHSPLDCRSHLSTPPIHLSHHSTATPPNPVRFFLAQTSVTISPSLPSWVVCATILYRRLVFMFVFRVACRIAAPRLSEPSSHSRTLTRFLSEPSSLQDSDRHTRAHARDPKSPKSPPAFRLHSPISLLHSFIHILQRNMLACKLGQPGGRDPPWLPRVHHTCPSPLAHVASVVCVVFCRTPCLPSVAAYLGASPFSVRVSS